MEIFLGIIGIGGMITAVGRSGYEGTQSTQNLKNHINDLNNLNASITEQYNNINKNLIDITIEESNALQKSIDELNILQKQMVYTVSDFSDSIRKTEIIGIIIIVIVFFLLLLKQFNLLQPLLNIIFYPFIFIYNQIFGKKTKNKK